jgi:hypothetical protein
MRMVNGHFVSGADIPKASERGLKVEGCFRHGNSAFGTAHRPPPGD